MVIENARAGMLSPGPSFLSPLLLMYAEHDVKGPVAVHGASPGKVEGAQDRIGAEEQAAAVESAACRRGVETVADFAGLEGPAEVQARPQSGGQVGKPVGVDKTANVVGAADEL